MILALPRLHMKVHESNKSFLQLSGDCSTVSGIRKNFSPRLSPDDKRLRSMLFGKRFSYFVLVLV